MLHSSEQRSVTLFAVRPAFAFDASLELGWPLSAIHAASSLFELAP